uniref:Uncharacterized protein n=1 Tax=Trichobilharzia regenti TaxID=157069 RepID=A0AA85JR66_TRIRE|nr:unnamed protein product [Trichobilharzia regenti]
MSSSVLLGLGLIGIGVAGRYITRRINVGSITELVKLSGINEKYYRGGFEPNMSKREAALILGVRWFTILGCKDQSSERYVGIK